MRKKNQLKNAKKLLAEAATCLGMIAEIQAKCRFFKSRLSKYEGSELPLEIHEEFLWHEGQMEEDLTKYSRRLAEIDEELRGYEIFSNMG
jgi:hypothetical protein